MARRIPILNRVKDDNLILELEIPIKIAKNESEILEKLFFDNIDKKML